MECRLKDLAQKITKGTTPSNIGEGFSDSGVMYFRSELIGKTKYIDRSAGLLYISEAVHDRLKRSQIEKNDILFSMAGIYLGKVSLVGEDDYPANTNQAVAIIRLKENACSHDYLYYYMTQKWFNVYVNLRTAQAAQPNINLEQIGKLKINLPNRKVQDEIASILSAYDDLIENNNRRIKILEQMAEKLYKEWFVRFRFPGYEQIEFENGIPKGWERNSISEFYRTSSGGTPSRAHEDYYADGIHPWVKTGELKDSIILDTEEYITQEAIQKTAARLHSNRSVAMAMYGVNIGMLGYFDSQMACNQACCVFVDRRNFSSRHYLFYCLKSMRDYLMLISFGAAQQNLSQDLIKKVKIIMPPDDLVKSFEEHVENVYKNIRCLLHTNKNLTKQRDKLLPRLMSGKLEV